MRTPLFLMTLLCLFVGLRAQEQEVWKRIRNKAFSFDIPSSFVKADARSVGSFSEDYSGQGMKLCVEFGVDTQPMLTWPKDKVIEPIQLDDRKGHMGVYQYSVIPDYPFTVQVYVQISEKVALGMLAYCRSKDDVTKARRIFSSISFNSPKAQQ